MPAATARTLRAGFDVFRPHLTRPSFEKFVLLACAWVLVGGRHTVAAGLVALGLGGVRDWTGFYRLFNRACWSAEALGRALLQQWVARLGPGALTFALDDTALPHVGPALWGLGTHRDPVRSSKRHKRFLTGHRWVVLALVVRLPFARRPWAIPVLLRLYRTRATCTATKDAHTKVTALARGTLETLAQWLPTRQLRVVVDAGLTNGTVMRGLPANLAVIGALRSDAVLTAVPPASARRTGSAGRPRQYGPRLPTPAALADDRRVPWQRVTATLYGRTRRPAYKTLRAQWRKACGPQELRVVVVRAFCARHATRAFVTTDVTLDVVALLESFAARWSIETLFRDLRQHFGWAHPQVRVRGAVERFAPFIAWVYGVVVLWAVRVRLGLGTAHVPVRRWYPRKRVLTFEDLVHAARGALWRSRVFGEATVFHDMPKTSPPPRAAAEGTILMAA